MKEKLKKLQERISSTGLIKKAMENKRLSARIAMAAAGGLLLLTFVLPLWSIRLEAPQYPIPLGMYIHINKITDAAPNDVTNINLLNHYVGMKKIPKHMPEFDIFPPIVLGMAALAFVLAGIGRHKLYLAWLIFMVILGSAGLYDFYRWEYDYGHNLSPHAILKFTDANGNPMGFQPPVLGTKHILNFVAHSYPASGAYAVFLGMGLAYVAFYLGKLGKRDESAAT